MSLISNNSTVRYANYYLLLIFAQLLWAGNSIVGNLAKGHIGPFTLSFYRWLIVALLLLPFVFSKLKTQILIVNTHWKLIFILSILGVVLYSSLIYLSLTHTSVVNSSLINATIPSFIVFISWLLYAEQIFFKNLFGVFLSFLGVIEIICQGNLSILLHVNLNIGDFLAFLAASVWSLYSILVKRLPHNLSPFVFLFFTSLISLIFLFPAYLVEQFLNIRTDINGFSLILIGYTAICPAILAYTFWNIGINKVGATRSGYFMNLLPVFSTALAILFLGESLHFYHMLGFSLVIIGIYLSTKTSPFVKQLEIEIKH